MFDEYKCGCIVSPFQGRVRIWTAVLRGIAKQYPANGQAVTGWRGR